MDRNKTIIFGTLGALALVIILVIYGFFSGGNEDPRAAIQAELQFWGVFDENVAYQNAIDTFNQIYPNVEIDYRRFNSIETYERNLIDALAAGSGPDILMVRNNDLARKENKLFRVPPEKYSVINLRQQFPAIVEKNFVLGGNIYAMPLSIDTLSLIYNNDIFSDNNVVFPPETWQEFTDVVPQLTAKDETGNITRSAAAFGGSENVERAKDILSLLMIQSGATMVNDSYTAASFSNNQQFNPLDFYTDFSRETSSVYTWSNMNQNSLQAFKEGEVAMIFNYHSALAEIESQYPYMDVRVAPVPQFSETSNKTSYAHYWGYGVSRQSEYPNVAWDFILTMTTNQSVAQTYLNITDRPPALSSLVQTYLDDPDYNVFASQILTAESWSEPHPERVTQSFNDMIERVLSGEDSPAASMSKARTEVTDMIKEL